MLRNQMLEDHYNDEVAYNMQHNQQQKVAMAQMNMQMMDMRLRGAQSASNFTDTGAGNGVTPCVACQARVGKEYLYSSFAEYDDIQPDKYCGHLLCTSCANVALLDPMGQGRELRNCPVCFVPLATKLVITAQNFLWEDQQRMQYEQQQRLMQQQLLQQNKLIQQQMQQQQRQIQQKYQLMQRQNFQQQQQQQRQLQIQSQNYFQPLQEQMTQQQSFSNGNYTGLERIYRTNAINSGVNNVQDFRPLLDLNSNNSTYLSSSENIPLGLLRRRGLTESMISSLQFLDNSGGIGMHNRQASLNDRNLEFYEVDNYDNSIMAPGRQINTNQQKDIGENYDQDKESLNSNEGSKPHRRGKSDGMSLSVQQDKLLNTASSAANGTRPLHNSDSDLNCDQPLNKYDVSDKNKKEGNEYKKSNTANGPKFHERSRSKKKLDLAGYDNRTCLFREGNILHTHIDCELLNDPKMVVTTFADQLPSNVHMCFMCSRKRQTYKQQGIASKYNSQQNDEPQQQFYKPLPQEQPIPQTQQQKQQKKSHQKKQEHEQHKSPSKFTKQESRFSLFRLSMRSSTKAKVAKVYCVRDSDLYHTTRKCSMIRKGTEVVGGKPQQFVNRKPCDHCKIPLTPTTDTTTVVKYETQQQGSDEYTQLPQQQIHSHENVSLDSPPQNLRHVQEYTEKQQPSPPTPQEQQKQQNLESEFNDATDQQNLVLKDGLKIYYVDGVNLYHATENCSMLQCISNLDNILKTTHTYVPTKQQLCSKCFASVMKGEQADQFIQDTSNSAPSYVNKAMYNSRINSTDNRLERQHSYNPSDNRSRSMNQQDVRNLSSKDLFLQQHLNNNWSSNDDKMSKNESDHHVKHTSIPLNNSIQPIHFIPKNSVISKKPNQTTDNKDDGFIDKQVIQQQGENKSPKQSPSDNCIEDKCKFVSTTDSKKLREEKVVSRINSAPLSIQQQTMVNDTQIKHRPTLSAGDLKPTCGGLTVFFSSSNKFVHTDRKCLYIWKDQNIRAGSWIDAGNQPNCPLCVDKKQVNPVTNGVVAVINKKKRGDTIWETELQGVKKVDMHAVKTAGSIAEPVKTFQIISL